MNDKYFAYLLRLIILDCRKIHNQFKFGHPWLDKSDPLFAIAKEISADVFYCLLSYRIQILCMLLRGKEPTYRFHDKEVISYLKRDTDFLRSLIFRVEKKFSRCSHEKN